jgi:Uma2 family endonuclease
VHEAQLYAEVGVPHYWIVSPAERILEAYELRDGAWVRQGAWDEGRTERIAPCQDIELEIGRLFPPRPE